MGCGPALKHSFIVNYLPFFYVDLMQLPYVEMSYGILNIFFHKIGVNTRIATSMTQYIVCLHHGHVMLPRAFYDIIPSSIPAVVPDNQARSFSGIVPLDVTV